MNKIYSTKQVAELFDLHEKSVSNACRRGIIKATKFSGRYMITEWALGEWVRTHYRPSRLDLNSDARQARELLEHIRNLCAPPDKQSETPAEGNTKASK
jgi:Helix-turn-helix domain